MALADDIRNEDDLPRERVETPEWKSCPAVWVRTLTATERDAFDDACMVGKGKKREFNYRELRARFAIAVTCDESGKSLFTDADRGWLGNKSSVVLNRIFAAGQKLNGLTAEDVEELVKN